MAVQWTAGEITDATKLISTPKRQAGWGSRVNPAALCAS